MYDFNDLLARLVAMEREAISGVDAVPYWPYQQEEAPYFWNRIGDMQVEYLAQDIAVDRYVVEIGLVIGHLTQGYSGENYTNVQNWIETFLTYLDTHADLTTTSAATPTAYTSRPDTLWTEARVIGIPGGTRTTSNSGLGPTQHVVVFTLDVPLLRQRY